MDHVQEEQETVGRPDEVDLTELGEEIQDIDNEQVEEDTEMTHDLSQSIMKIDDREIPEEDDFELP